MNTTEINLPSRSTGAPHPVEPATLWLSSQTSEDLWNDLNLPPTSTSPNKQKLPTIASSAEEWTTGHSAEEAWANLGKATPQLPSPDPSEYPTGINPFAIAKASKDAWEHLSDTHPWNNTQRASAKKTRTKDNLTVGGAAWQLAKAAILQRGILFIPPASKLEDRVISWGEKQLQKLGLNIDLELPDPQYIHQEVDRIRGQYLAIDPHIDAKAPHTNGDPEMRIVKAAEQMVEVLYKGALDSSYPVTEQEKALATQLLLAKQQHISREEIDHILREAVLGIAGDIAQRQNKHLLFSRYQRVGSALNELATQQEPTKMFITDIITSKIVLTDEEEKIHGTRVWGLTPTKIIIRNITGGTGSDNIIIPLSLLTVSRSGINGGILMASATPDAVDIIRKKTSRLAQSTVFRWAGKAQVGGMVTFYSLERDKMLGEIVVDDPADTMRQLHSLAETIRRTHQIVTESKDSIRQQEAGLETKFIRPNVVLRELGAQETQSQFSRAHIRQSQILNKLNLLYDNFAKKGQARIRPNSGKVEWDSPIAAKQADQLQQELREIQQILTPTPQLPSSTIN